MTSRDDTRADHLATAEVAPAAPEAEVVLHTERLLAQTRRVPVERVRLAKRIVTTTRTVEVPVRVEQLVVTREPLDGETTATHDAVGGAASAGGDLVVVLHEEVPEVSVRVVPVEKVTVTVRTVSGEQVLDAELHTEVVDVERDGPSRTDV